MNRRWEMVDYQVGQIVEKPIPEPEPTGLIVKVAYSGVCHSDAHLFKAAMPNPLWLPIVLGHEISGTVHSLGDVVEEDAEPDLAVGDRVVVFPWGGCRRCWVCRGAGSQHCMVRHQQAAHQYGLMMDGGYQAFVSVRSRFSAVRVPAALPLDVACLLPCSAVTAYHAVTQAASAVEYAVTGKGRANVVLVGAGGLSLWAMAFLRAKYGDKVRVLAADIDVSDSIPMVFTASGQEEKLSDARDRVDEVLCWTADAASAECSTALVAALGGERVDAAIDFVGAPSTVERVYNALSFNATLAVVGIFGGEMPRLPIQKHVVTNVRLQGVYCGSRAMLQEVMQYCIDNKISGPTLQKIGLEEVDGVLRGMLAGTTQRGRAIVQF